MPVRKQKRETRPRVLRKAAIDMLRARTRAKGEIIWPAIPALIDHYLNCLDDMFAAAGRKFSLEELDGLRGHLKMHLDAAFGRSQHSTIRVEYFTEAPPETTLRYVITNNVSSIDDEYTSWVNYRTPPLFGKKPDSKVMTTARSLGDPGDVAILDIGAGTGRNALPLAREGFIVDAVDVTESFAVALESESHLLPLRVLIGDALSDTLDIQDECYNMVLLSQVTSHFRGFPQLQTLFERSSRWLKPGGTLLFNVFVWIGDYEPEPFIREMSQTMWCSAFSLDDILAAADGLPFKLISDEPVCELEKENSQPSDWPPTGWFETWTRGHDLFSLPEGKPPIEMRWLAFQRSAIQKSNSQHE